MPRKSDYGEQLRRRDEAASNAQQVTAEEARATQIERERNYRRKLAEDRNWRFKSKKDYSAWVLRAELPSYLARRPAPLTARAAERTAPVADAGDREGRVGLTRAAGEEAERARRAAAAAPNSDPFAGKTKAQIRVMQRQVGFTGRDVDGIAGPKTRAAWAARQGVTDTGNILAGGGTVRATPAISPRQQGPAGVPAVAAGATTPAPAGVRPAGVSDVSDIDVQTAFPQLGAFLRIPEVGEILRSAVAEGWPPDKLAARVQQTEWWRTTPATTRMWLGLRALDPATTERKVADKAAEFRMMAKDYFLDLPDVTTKLWAEKVLSGEVGADGFNQYLKEMGKSLHPALAGAIDRGITPAQYAEPYRQVSAKLLEISPDAIDFSHPKWSKALLNIDPKTGSHVAMSLSDWQNELRMNPIYGYDRTSQARQEAAQMAEKIGQTFGKVA